MNASTSCSASSISSASFANRGRSLSPSHATAAAHPVGSPERTPSWREVLSLDPVNKRDWNQLKSQLKSTTADDLINALNRDEWAEEDRRGATRGFVKDGRRVVIHYHPGKTYGQKFLKGLIDDTGWTRRDLQTLKLIKR